MQVMFLLKIINNRFFAPLILIAFMLLFSFLNIEKTTIDPNDETLYLLAMKNVIPTWAPIYSKYFSLISLFTSDKLKIYDISQVITCSVLWPLSLFYIIRASGGTPLLGLLLSITLSIAKGAFVSFPHIHIFNLSILFLCYYWLYHRRSLFLKIIFFFLFGASIYIRQDNYIIFGVFIVLVTIFEWRKWDLKGRLIHFFSPVIFMLGFGALFLQWGSPFHDRVILAFKDHYIWRNPQIVSDHVKFNERYPKASSLDKFIFNYPEDFKNHLTKNLLELPKRMMNSVSGNGITIGSSRLTNLPTLIILIFVYLLSFLNRQYFLDFSQKDQSLNPFFIAIVAQGLNLALILQPFEKYLMGLNATLFCFTIPNLLFKFSKQINFNFRFKSILNYCSTITIITALSFQLFANDSSYYDLYGQKMRIIIHDISSNNIKKNKDLTLAIDHIFAYATPGEYYGLTINSYISNYSNKRDFGDFLIERQINLFCLMKEDLSWTPLSYIAGLKEVENFLSNYSKYGYYLVKFKPNSSGIMCLRRDNFK